MAQVRECTTQADAARRLGVTRHRVNNLIQMGRLRAEQLADLKRSEEDDEIFLTMDRLMA